MEAIPFNPNSAAPKSATRAADPASPPKDKEEFSPLMEKAVTQHTKKNERREAPADAPQENKAKAPEPSDSDDPAIAEDDSNQIKEDATSKSALILSLIQLPAAQQKSTSSAPIPVVPGPETAKTSLPGLDSPRPIVLSEGGNGQQVASKSESLLLQQIQDILDQGKNKGPLTITSTPTPTPDGKELRDTLQNLSNPLLSTAPDNTPAAISDESSKITVSLTGTEAKTVAPPMGKSHGPHQDIGQQYLQAKLADATGSTSDDAQQGTDQQGNNKQQLNPSQASPGSMLEGKPAEAGFVQQLSLNTPLSQGNSVEGKMAPGAPLLVPEKEMVDNLVQRFGINPRLQTSKITMQLHPIELGSIKIDLLVKNNSISANIVAQSQQVRETLEKHMPRLRTALQDQGFTIDSFEISLEGDGGQQTELFQGNFGSSQQEFVSSGAAPEQNDVFEDLLDSSQESAGTEETDNTAQDGVNLTV